MVVLKKKITLTRENTCSHIDIAFNVPSEGKVLYINFSYSPHRYYDKDECMKLLKEAVVHYEPERSFSDEELDKYFPLKNLLTVSLDSPEGVVGAAHRHNDNQKHMISAVESSRGFIKQRIIKGLWNVTISAHSIVSPTVNVELEVSYE